MFLRFDEDRLLLYTLRFYDITSIFFRLISIFQYRGYCISPGVVRISDGYGRVFF